MAKNEYQLGQTRFNNRGGGRMRVAEKPKDLKGTLKLLLNYLGNYIPSLLVSFTCVMISVLLTLFAPNQLSKITDLIKDGMEAGFIDTGSILFLSMRILLFYLFSSILVFVEAWVMVTTTSKLGRQMRGDISHKLNTIPLKHFDNASFGDLLSRVTNDVDTLTMSLRNSVTEIVSAVTTFMGCTILMLMTNVPLAMISMFFSFVGLFVMRIVIKKSQPYFSARQRYLGEINGHIEEIYAGHLIEKAFNGEEDAYEEFERINKLLYESNWKSQFLGGINRPMMELLSNLGYVAVCVAGAVMVMKGSISFGVIVAFILYVRMFTQPLGMVAQAMVQFQSAIAGAERIFAFLGETEMSDESKKTRRLKDVKGEIEFEHVKFGYVPERIIIHDFNVKIEPGQNVAIVGPTGAGKTTLVNLLMRFYDVDDGAIKIDGIPTAEVTRENVHDQFCMVLQDTWLFEGTIFENIAYCRPDITREEVVNACKAVGLHRFITSLPNGYDTVLTDSTNLSAGQRQLMTIARAMVDKAKFLILDEATSSVDTRTEQLVQDAMDKLTEGRTSFTIAHRLSTIRKADIILVMRDGDIVETGSHEELLERGGFYAELWNSQFVNAEVI